MIHDKIDNIDRYQDDVKLYAALVALKHYIDGEAYDKSDVTSCNRQECDTILREEAKLEHHRKYIDIHYVIKGTENILVNYSKRLERLTDYSEEKDFELFALTGKERCIELREGEFAVIYPGESHAPKIAVNNEIAPISKVVVKL